MTDSGKAPDVSIVVPTYGEAGNLPGLMRHVDAGLEGSGLSWEIIIANDESGDNTTEVCEELARDWPVRLLNRTKDRGLALAVIDGAKLALGDHVVVMDGDLSHPAELVPRMIKELSSGQARMVIGSRNVASASTDDKWPIMRRIGTFCATSLARPIAHVNDPMSGFFALRRADWPQEGLRPIGYKIGLEILVRAGFGKGDVVELPIHFTDRKIGESKMGGRELHNYLQHLLNLYRFRWPAFRILMHCAVGAVGLVIDTLIFLGLQYAGVGHLTARLVSYWPANASNWWLNRKYTYDDRPLRAKVAQLAEFTYFSLIGFAVNGVVYHLLTEHIAFFDANKLTALVVGVIAGLAVNYVGSTLRVYGKDQALPKSSS